MELSAVFRSSRRPPRPQAIDLSTIRETVSYMHDDAVRTPGCERLAIAFGAVLREIDAAERQRLASPVGEIISARFIPFRRAKDASDRSA